MPRSIAPSQKPELPIYEAQILSSLQFPRAKIATAMRLTVLLHNTWALAILRSPLATSMSGLGPRQPTGTS